MAVFPFILVRTRKLALQQRLLNHERIHLRQQAELLIMPFFIWYVTEYIIRLLIYRNHDEAYRNICFEREAYNNESNPSYLRKRPMWNFCRYLQVPQN